MKGLTDMIRLCAWLWKSAFTCNHLNTPVNEGKCFCPDCGRGLLYQWIVLRCRECNSRRESRYFLRHAVPVQSCCVFCGTHDFIVETLPSPAYYQLNQARLVVVEDSEPRDEHSHSWTMYTIAEQWAQTRQMAEQWLNPRPAQVLGLLPTSLNT